MAISTAFYHLGFSREDLGEAAPRLAFLSGDPDRARWIAERYLSEVRKLSENRGLNSYLGRLPSGAWVLSATSGMGAPSLSIVVNELVQAGIRIIIRVGTTGSIQAQVKPGEVVISSAALCRQGAANDIAPVEYPAAADPFLTVALARAARALEIPHTLASQQAWIRSTRVRSATTLLIRTCCVGCTGSRRSIVGLTFLTTRWSAARCSRWAACMASWRAVSVA